MCSFNKNLDCYSSNSFIWFSNIELKVMVVTQSNEAPVGQSRASTPNTIATPSIPSVDSRNLVATTDSQEPKC